ncbi:DUF697 domain-containing protein [candidate division KSB3 bacterium]|uniref:DUF697 domain-containing protein n=1 Tax=candidate division KSB3 bacterium TaxID=2044937 RepID=A0A9D5Q4Y8_9BACT|nr:DUF697 domain-containing protein [candidate division KSB3 bacterium]MBD3323697.1 DUF697 domain-containing protein [candidate division KSB3 bacterium]
MTDSQQPSASKTTVSRRRKRLYDPLPEDLPSGGDSSSVPQPAAALEPDRIRKHEAQKIIDHYMLWSAGTALIPVPFVDTAAFTAVELKMLKRLCEQYGLPFSKHRGKAFIASLIGGVEVRVLTASLLKFVVPGFGFAGGVLTMGAISGALTYAIGKVFLLHFETGGTLLDFDPSTMQAYFVEQYHKGHAVASKLHQKK